MVYINQVELTNFKSFGGSMTIPLEEGFTVVTGPNGSGKSNILDGILFCLGLATSRGMRADRLPDLVNSGVLRAGKSAETVVSVRFDLQDWQPDSAEDGLEIPKEGPWIKPDQKQWTVTRRLRVMPGGSYSSIYSADGEICNLQQLQTQLRRLRIDPEGSNVVMQGDVTRIVSMSNKDRRGLIDELAGVALFDHRIDQARTKLDDVFERQERCRIVEQELFTSKVRLEKDCEKARLYKQLKEQHQLARQQESVLAFEVAKDSLEQLKTRRRKLLEKETLDQNILLEKQKTLQTSSEILSKLQEEVKALGEDKLIAVQAEIAGIETQARELERQAGQHKLDGEKLQEKRKELINRHQEINEDVPEDIDSELSKRLQLAESKCKDAESAVEVSRRRLADVAGRSGALVEEHRDRNFARQNLHSQLKPLQHEQQKLEERLLQITERLDELAVDQTKDSCEDKKLQNELNLLDNEWKLLVDQIDQLKHFVDSTSEDLSIQERTRFRLEKDQARMEKEIARLESRRETLNESRGTGALRLLLQSGLEGIHGPVAQLAEVDNIHRLAVEVAAGARIGQIVVDNDQIAARAIDLLKTKKAGRLTFLPLNKIKSSGDNSKLKSFSNATNRYMEGLIGGAIELVKFESIYKGVFSYVFGDTLVFKDINSARSYLGRYRSVTLGGELLEKSGAMTGGNFSARSGALSFGISTEADEIEPLRQRLLELGETLLKCRKEEASLRDLLNQNRPLLSKLEKRQASLDAQRSTFKRSNSPLIERTKERADRLNALGKTKQEYILRLGSLKQAIEPLVIALKDLEDKEKLVKSDEHSENWRKLQDDLEAADAMLVEARAERDDLLNDKRQRELVLDRLEDQKNSLIAEQDRLQESIDLLTKQHIKWREQNQALGVHRKELEKEKQNLETHFGQKRQERDKAEADLANQRQKLQDLQFKFERLKEEILSVNEELRHSHIRLNELEANLPDPLPDIPEEVRINGLDFIQDQLKNLENRLEALEPVNMLALEELEKLESRLFALAEKLEVLTEERSELLLRVETVATLRQEAFMEAFEAVDGYFREIFASLSEGDGHLQLDNPEDPLEGGLTLVAHPKGKSVRRLAAMSGGEKSLTALSFLFALQRFRPSPFYALDEVDSFLDGVNVERLSSLIARQSEDAQFMVVSHRRPMIGAATRTIGVTQARGNHTQVVGLPTAA
ncbi:chromosome segregation protein SMC [Prochlorococcus marinus]|uniref:chromosome segregation protein SMC n=1 Tax=Prochlorococcus marinus TaxID=1219 RepID=UPI00059B8823|nr:chromosome segregation protein SMC [Prochlorococcus marinus]